jgi:hypothetical protein
LAISLITVILDAIYFIACILTPRALPLLAALMADLMAMLSIAFFILGKSN